VIAFELPPGSKELRVFEESLAVSGSPIYTRERTEVHVTRAGQGTEGAFNLDSQQTALPIIVPASPNHLFRDWLGHMQILRPLPALIKGDSDYETLVPNPDVTDFGAWFSGIQSEAPAAYTKIDKYLKQVMPDFQALTNPSIGRDARSLSVQFANEGGKRSMPFEDLSDGEKYFMICAVVLALEEVFIQPFCFWDEPDNYLAPDEIGHFVTALRKAFQSTGQFIATSHNIEAISQFSDENTLVLHRRNHLEPTTVRVLRDLNLNGDLATALLLGDLVS